MKQRTVFCLLAVLSVTSVLPATAQDSYHRAVQNAQQAGQKIRTRNAAQTDLIHASNARRPSVRIHIPGLDEMRSVPSGAVYSGRKVTVQQAPH